MKIFLDDERYPPDGENMVIVRTFPGFCQLIHHATIATIPQTIEFISFDHDLGHTDSPADGMDCVKFLVNYDLNKDILTEDFHFYVHSQNPVGKKNIEGYLNNYLDLKFGRV